ncbi:hypothetical protein OG381_34545 [Streptomyces sp. NBC_00490]|uniref:hypothetical protein n=1 Tax=Streptomyces sp. NBC_00490 TaxID=2903657 RepID=UPI002E16FC86
MARIIQRITKLAPADDPYPLPSEVQVMGVSPEMASSWSSYRSGHPKLRHLSPVVVGKYKDLIEAGDFCEATPEGLVFDTEGYIISAQHRLAALANADPAKLIEHYGRPWLNLWIFPNQPRDIAPYLDQPHRRTAAHLLVGTAYAKDIGAGSKMLAALAIGDRFGTPSFNSVSVPQTVANARAWPELERYAAEVYGIWRVTSIPRGHHLAVLAQAARTEHAAAIPAWLEGLRTGANLTETDPRLLLRGKFRGGFVSQAKVTKRDQQYAVIVKCWNAYLTGEVINPIGLRFRAGEVMPLVEGYGANREREAA